MKRLALGSMHAQTNERFQKWNKRSGDQTHLDRELAKVIETTVPAEVRAEERPAALGRRSKRPVNEYAEIVLSRTHVAKDVNGKLYAYKDGVYVPNALDLEIRTALGVHFDIRLASNVREYLRIGAPSLLEVPPEDKVIVLNGIVDLAGEQPTLIAHTPDLRSPNLIPIEFDPEATCPRFDDYLRSLGPEEMVPALEEMLGLLVAPVEKIHKIPILVGPGGSGKSLFLKVIEKIIGRSNCTFQSAEQLTKREFRRAHLLHKLANLCADGGSRRLEDASFLKQVASRDTVSVENKHVSATDVQLYARIILAANNYPRSNDLDGGLLRRFTIVPFDRVFVGESADGSGETEARVEERVLLEMVQAELPGILNLALRARRRLLSQGDFTQCAALEQARAECKSAIDPIWAFCDEQIEKADSGGVIDAPDLYGAVNRYLERQGSPAQTASGISGRVRAYLSWKGINADFEGSKGKDRPGRWTKIKWRFGTPQVRP